MRWDVVLNSPGNLIRVMTLLQREQTDVCQTSRDGFLNVPIVVVFSPGPVGHLCPKRAFAFNALTHSVTESATGTKPRAVGHTRFSPNAAATHVRL